MKLNVSDNFNKTVVDQYLPIPTMSKSMFKERAEQGAGAEYLLWILTVNLALNIGAKHKHLELSSSTGTDQ